MDRIRGLLVRIRSLFARASADRELDAELRHHIELDTAHGVARGLAPAAARRAALLRFGAGERYREEARELRGGRWLEELRADARLALRQLRHNRVVAFAAVASLALGIGANTAIFSVIDAVLLRALPYTQPDDLVVVWQTDAASGTLHEPASWPDIVDYRERSRTLQGVAAFAGWDATLLLPGGEPERVAALGVTPDALQVLGVEPLAGRLFAADEVAPGGEQYVVVSEAWWRSRLGGDTRAIGTSLTINERPAMIIGVVPSDADVGFLQIQARADYHVPLRGARVDVYLAMQPDAAFYPRSTHPFLVVGRLAPGVSVTAATDELAAIALDLAALHPENDGRGARIDALTHVIFGPVRPALLVLLGAVAFVLLVTCANVANLLLARTAARGREMALRRALGATGGRIGRQLFVESAVLTAAGAALGVAVARMGLAALRRLAPADIPRIDAATLDARVLLFTLLVSGAVALAFGMVPALQLRSLDLQRVLKAGSVRTGSASRGARRVRAALVVAEIAIAVSLVIGAGLLLRSFRELRAVDPGFQASGVLKAEYQLPSTRYRLDFSRWPHLPQITRVHDELLRSAVALPGVEAAALAAPHPLEAGFTNSFTIVGREAESAALPEIRTRFVSPGYLATLRVPLLAGRDLAAGDVAGAPPVALINRAAATRYFAGVEPVGRQLRFWGTAWTVVGVIGDERFRGLATAAEPAVYTPLAQAPQLGAALLVRSAGDPAVHAAAIRRALREIDPQLALHGVERLDATLAGSLARPRFLALLLTLFGAVAIVLALIGVYGVLSYSVAQRHDEVGVRVALGAAHADVLRLILGEGLRLAMIGTTIGVLIALALSKLIATLLFGVSPTDARTFVVVSIGVLLTALLAGALPAARALRTPPAAVLRAD